MVHENMKWYGGTPVCPYHLMKIFAHLLAQADYF
jgi:hypothetical protein